MVGPSFEFIDLRTTLSYLAEFDDEVIFALRLEGGGILPDSKDQDERTPLSWAALSGHEAQLIRCSNTCHQCQFEVRRIRILEKSLSIYSTLSRITNNTSLSIGHVLQTMTLSKQY